MDEVLKWLKKEEKYSIYCKSCQNWFIEDFKHYWKNSPIYSSKYSYHSICNNCATGNIIIVTDYKKIDYKKFNNDYKIIMQEEEDALFETRKNKMRAKHPYIEKMKNVFNEDDGNNLEILWNVIKSIFIIGSFFNVWNFSSSSDEVITSGKCQGMTESDCDYNYWRAIEPGH